MREHPISPVTEPMQYRAIGVVRGRFLPTDAAQPNRGVIRTADGSDLEAVVLGRLLTLMRRHLDPEQPHLWVVYPRSRDENHLHLQLVGVWEPSTLSPAGATDDAAAAAEPVPAAAESGPTAETAGSAPQPPDAADVLPEGDDYFSIRGELIFTRPETGELVIKVRQQPRPDGSRPIPFKLRLRGEVPLEHLRHFVSLDLRRRGQELHLEAFEVIGPLPQRGQRGGRNRRNGPAGREGAEGAAAGRGTGRRGGERPAAPVAAVPRPHGRAVSRPSR